MDPNSALQLLIDAINDCDFETACEAGNGYAAWLARGGFHANSELHDFYVAFRWASELPMAIVEVDGCYEYSLYCSSGGGYESRAAAVKGAFDDYSSYLDSEICPEIEWIFE